VLIVVELKFLYNKIASYLAVFKINEYFCKLLESIKTNYYDRSKSLYFSYLYKNINLM